MNLKHLAKVTDCPLQSTFSLLLSIVPCTGDGDGWRVACQGGDRAGGEEIFFSPLKLNAVMFKWYHWCWGCLVFALDLLELILSLLLVSSVGGWL